MRQPQPQRPHLYLVERDVVPHAPQQRHDAQIARALELMRTSLAQPWTVAGLARRVGLSRPVFARRFVAATGTSPLKYLTRVRMERAAELLTITDVGLAQIASHVGYDSEFAFNRAFKRVRRIAPGRFRRMLRNPTGPVLRAAA